MTHPNQKLYQQKLVSADQAVRHIQSGSRIYYGEFVLFPQTLDQALARRMAEAGLSDITIETVCMTRIPEALKQPETAECRVPSATHHMNARTIAPRSKYGRPH